MKTRIVELEAEVAYWKGMANYYIRRLRWAGIHYDEPQDTSQEPTQECWQQLSLPGVK